MSDDDLCQCGHIRAHHWYDNPDGQGRCDYREVCRCHTFRLAAGAGEVTPAFDAIRAASETEARSIFRDAIGVVAKDAYEQATARGHAAGAAEERARIVAVIEAELAELDTQLPKNDMMAAAVGYAEGGLKRLLSKVRQ